MAAGGVCSLHPGATETLAALGLAGRLTGISNRCDWPESVAALPQLTRTIGAEQRLDMDALAALAPAGVVVPAELLPQIDRGRLGDADVIVVDPQRIVEIEAMVAHLADRMGVAGRAAEVVDTIQKPIESVLAAVIGVERPPVLVLESVRPPVAAGGWVPEMVGIAGGRAVIGEGGAPARPTSAEEITGAGPALVVVALRWEDAAAAAREASRLTGLDRPLVAVDAHAYYSRPGPRITYGIVQLAHLMHPDRVADPGVPAIAVGGAGGAGR
jgi:iron complex transport system substrate-binding protein